MPIIGSSASQSGKVPGAATITGVTAGDGQVTVAFTEPAFKGKGNVTYTVTSSPSGITATGSSSPIVVSGLTNGTSYTFTVAAVSTNGVSSSSSASSSVAPIAPRNGYVGGGNDGSVTSTIDKISFSNDSKSTLTATLSTGKWSMAGASNSGTAGYFFGGTDSGINRISGIEKLLFLNESRSTLGAVLSTARTSASAMANSGTAAYTCGGDDANFNYTGVQKLLFSNDSISTLSATIPTPRRSHSGMANSGTAGYFSGGQDMQEGTLFSNILKVLFSNETVSTLSGTLTNAKEFSASFANSGTAGYVAGGFTTSAYTSTIDKISFSNDSKSTLTATLSTGRRQIPSSGMANSGVAGYVAGGQNVGDITTSNIDKLLFSNESRSILAATLTSAKIRPTAFANSGTL